MRAILRPVIFLLASAATAALPGLVAPLADSALDGRPVFVVGLAGALGVPPRGAFCRGSARRRSGSGV